MDDIFCNRIKLTNLSDLYYMVDNRKEFYIKCHDLSDRRRIIQILIDSGVSFNPNSLRYLDLTYHDFEYRHPHIKGDGTTACCSSTIPFGEVYIDCEDIFELEALCHQKELPDVNEVDFTDGLSMLLGV